MHVLHCMYFHHSILYCFFCLLSFTLFTCASVLSTLLTIFSCKILTVLMFYFVQEIPAGGCDCWFALHRDKKYKSLLPGRCRLRLQLVAKTVCFLLSLNVLSVLLTIIAHLPLIYR